MEIMPRTRLSIQSHRPIAYPSIQFTLNSAHNFWKPSIKPVPMSSLTCLLLTLSLAFTSAAANPTTVYEALESYGFPPGLVPKGATGYELDPATGKFSVHLNSSCSFTIDGYDLKYKDTITGTISTDKVKDLTGIQVKVLLFWVNIIEVTKDGDQLELSVGIASADFPVDNFYESPQCGCGFDCVNREKWNRKFNFNDLIPLVEV